MTAQEFDGICQAVKNGAIICIKHNNGKEGKVLGCVQVTEEFEVEVKVTKALEVWHYTKVTEVVPC